VATLIPYSPAFIVVAGPMVLTGVGTVFARSIIASDAPGLHLTAAPVAPPLEARYGPYSHFLFRCSCAQKKGRQCWLSGPFHN
jgi:hypothetical protein